MPTKSASAKFRAVLDRLEADYGRLVPTDDPVEAGTMTLLAEHAPALATEEHRDALRDWFVDWNEARVADPWDISRAMGAKPGAGGKKFAKAMLRFLKSLHGALNRCSFDVAVANSEADVEVLVGKMRGAPPATRAVMLAALDVAGGWHPGREMAKVAQQLGFAPKTTSLAKVGSALADVAAPDDRLRAHYLLTRYATRGSDDADPLASPKKKDAANAAAKKPAAKKPTAKKPAAKKPAAKKPAAKKPAAKKPAAKKPAAKKPTAKKPTAKKATKKG